MICGQVITARQNVGSSVHPSPDFHIRAVLIWVGKTQTSKKSTMKPSKTIFIIYMYVYIYILYDFGEKEWFGVIRAWFGVMGVWTTPKWLCKMIQYMVYFIRGTSSILAILTNPKFDKAASGWKKQLRAGILARAVFLKLIKAWTASG